MFQNISQGVFSSKNVVKRCQPQAEAHDRVPQELWASCSHSLMRDLIKSKRQPREQFVQFLKESVFQFSRFYSKKTHFKNESSLISPSLQKPIGVGLNSFFFFCFMHHFVYFTVFLKTLADSVQFICRQFLCSSDAFK